MARLRRRAEPSDAQWRYIENIVGSGLLDEGAAVEMTKIRIKSNATAFLNKWVPVYKKALLQRYNDTDYAEAHAFGGDVGKFHEDPFIVLMQVFPDDWCL